MPLLDHFRMPISKKGSWEGFHGMCTRSRFESWAYPMVVGERLPVLPIWLDNDHAISIDLEVSYQQTCSALRLI